MSLVWGQRGAWDPYLRAQRTKNRRTPKRERFLRARVIFNGGLLGLRFGLLGLKWSTSRSDGAEVVSFLVCGAGFVPLCGNSGKSWEPYFEAKRMKNVEQRIGQSFLLAKRYIEWWSAGTPLGLLGLTRSPSRRSARAVGIWAVGLWVKCVIERWGVFGANT